MEKSNSYNSGQVFCIHYCFNYRISSVNKHCYLLEQKAISVTIHYTGTLNNFKGFIFLLEGGGVVYVAVHYAVEGPKGLDMVLSVGIH